MLQIEAPITLQSALVIGISVMSTALVFVFALYKTSQKQYLKTVQELYKDQLKDNKEIITNNTKALVEHSSVIEQQIEISQELKNTISRSSVDQIAILNDLKLWLRENVLKPSK